MKGDFWSKTWNLGAMNNYKFLLPGLISNDSIPVLSKLMMFRDERNEPFTIRDAVWAARLYKMVADNIQLSIYVTVYSLLEKISFLSQTELDTSMLDFSIEAGLPNGPGVFVQIQSMPIPDDYKIALGKDWADRLEKKILGYEVSKGTVLNGQSWLGYDLWLGNLSGLTEFNKLTKRKKEPLFV
jgi:hypothetical protein